MTGYYDRQRRPLTAARANELLDDPAYRQLAVTRVYSARCPTTEAWVSTVWRGRDEILADRMPDQIFETEVFSEALMDIDGWEQWYETERQALDGHLAVVDQVSECLVEPVAEHDTQQANEPAATIGIGRDIIAVIDTAVGCQECGRGLGTSPSSDFCGESCQQDWHHKRIGAGTGLPGHRSVTGPYTYTYRRFADPMARGDAGPGRDTDGDWAAWAERSARAAAANPCGQWAPLGGSWLFDDDPRRGGRR